MSNESGFDAVMNRIFQTEGGYVANDAGKGETNFGINVSANPEYRGRIKSLTREEAKEIYRRKYWNVIGGENISPELQYQAMDAAVNQGAERARGWVAASGGDKAKFIELRRQRYEEIMAANPSKRQFRNTWMNRLKEGKASNYEYTDFTKYTPDAIKADPSYIQRQNELTDLFHSIDQQNAAKLERDKKASDDALNNLTDPRNSRNSPDGFSFTPSTYDDNAVLTAQDHQQQEEARSANASAKYAEDQKFSSAFGNSTQSMINGIRAVTPEFVHTAIEDTVSSAQRMADRLPDGMVRNFVDTSLAAYVHAKDVLNPHFRADPNFNARQHIQDRTEIDINQLDQHGQENILAAQSKDEFDYELTLSKQRTQDKDILAQGNQFVSGVANLYSTIANPLEVATFVVGGELVTAAKAARFGLAAAKVANEAKLGVGLADNAVSSVAYAGVRHIEGESTSLTTDLMLGSGLALAGRAIGKGFDVLMGSRTEELLQLNNVAKEQAAARRPEFLSSARAQLGVDAADEDVAKLADQLQSSESGKILSASMADSKNRQVGIDYTDMTPEQKVEYEAKQSQINQFKKDEEALIERQNSRAARAEAKQGSEKAADDAKDAVAKNEEEIALENETGLTTNAKGEIIYNPSNAGPLASAETMAAREGLAKTVTAKATAMAQDMSARISNFKIPTHLKGLGKKINGRIALKWEGGTRLITRNDWEAIAMLKANKTVKKKAVVGFDKEGNKIKATESLHANEYIGSAQEAGMKQALMKEYNDLMRSRIADFKKSNGGVLPEKIDARDMVSDAELNEMVARHSRDQAIADVVKDMPPMQQSLFTSLPVAEKSVVTKSAQDAADAFNKKLKNKIEDKRLDPANDPKTYSMDEKMEKLGISDKFRNAVYSSQDLEVGVRMQMLENQSLKNTKTVESSVDVARKVEHAQKMQGPWWKGWGLLGLTKAPSTIMVASESSIVRDAAYKLLELPLGAVQSSTAALEKYALERAMMGRAEPIYQNARKMYALKQGKTAWAYLRDKELTNQFNRDLWEYKSLSPEERAIYPHHNEFMQINAELSRGYEMQRILQIKHKVKGWESLPENSDMYIPYQTDPEKYGAMSATQKKSFVDQMMASVREANPDLTEREIQKITASYANVLDANAVSGHGSSTNSLGVQGSSDLQEALNKADFADEERKVIGQKIRFAMENMDTRKIKRNIMDTFGEGNEQLRLADILENDQLKLMRSQSSRISGEVAVARYGIKGREGFEDIRRVAIAQGATKEEVEALNQIEKEFLNIPQGNGGRPPSAKLNLFLSVARTLMLQSMVVTQVIEFANAAIHLGVLRTIGGLPDILRHAKNAKRLAGGGASKDKILDQGLADMIGDPSQMAYSNIIGEGSSDFMPAYSAADLSVAAKLAAGAENATQRMTGFHALLAGQQRFAMDQIAKKAAKWIKSGDVTKKAHLRDMGFTDELIESLKDDAAFVFDEAGELVEFIPMRSNNMEGVRDFASSVRRGTGQIFQETFIGERGAWVHDDVFKFLSMFRSYPLHALQKQTARSISTHGLTKSAMYAMGAAGFGAAVAYAKAELKTAGMSDHDKEKYFKRNVSPEKLAMAGWSYSALGSLSGEFVGMGMAAMGMETSTYRVGGNASMAQYHPGLGLIQSGINSVGDVRDLATGKKTKANNLMQLLPFVKTPQAVVVRNLIDHYSD